MAILLTLLLPVGTSQGQINLPIGTGAYTPMALRLDINQIVPPLPPKPDFDALRAKLRAAYTAHVEALRTDCADKGGTLTDKNTCYVPPPPPPPPPAQAPVYVAPAPVSGSHTDWMAAAGIAPSDYGYVDFIITNESGWRYWVVNTEGSGATGLCQALPGSKMASAGADYLTNPVTQLSWCNSYAQSRYGGWYNAYTYWVNHRNW